MRKFFILLKQAAVNWRDDKVSRLAAALAYHTAVSLVPLLVIVIAIAGLIFNPQTVQTMIVSEFGDLVGADTARTIERLIENGRFSNSSLPQTILGGSILIFAASGLFNQVQAAINKVWGVEDQQAPSIKEVFTKRLFSFAMVAGSGVLLIASLVISSLLAFLNRLLADAMPGPGIDLRIINMLMFLGLFTVIFATVNKVLPDADIAWKDVWIGGIVTSLLFAFGNMLVGLYITYSRVDSIYGVAGSVIVFLLWVYYTAQIVLFGAEFTQVYANRETIWE